MGGVYSQNVLIIALAQVSFKLSYRIFSSRDPEKTLSFEGFGEGLKVANQEVKNDGNRVFFVFFEDSKLP